MKKTKIKNTKVLLECCVATEICNATENSCIQFQLKTTLGGGTVERQITMLAGPAHTGSRFSADDEEPRDVTKRRRWTELSAFALILRCGTVPRIFYQKPSTFSTPTYLPSKRTARFGTPRARVTKLDKPYLLYWRSRLWVTGHHILRCIRCVFSASRNYRQLTTDDGVP